MLLTIKETAKKLNLTEYTIRFYTDKGLVPSVQRGANNQRLFDQESLNWLQGSHYLRQTGMSIANVKNYVDLCLEGNQTVPERYQLIQQQQIKAKQQLKEDQEKLAFLEGKAKLYENILNEPNKDILNPGTWQSKKQASKTS
ncbi:MerR family transcriptional regulator [Ligilactobacillus acidipiscis]|uniref:MerR family transcriptional regulator n=1 Tax=Ligilactobacillus acidipiscis TaxID=89059 RepID=UPI0022E166C9|nr:MerR family transcriptional regulator [Ligilactobacillus acidipiscis]